MYICVCSVKKISDADGEYAMKFVDYDDKLQMRTLKHEASILKDLDSPHVIKLMEVSENPVPMYLPSPRQGSDQHKLSNIRTDSEFSYLVLELASKGDLFELINTNGGLSDLLARHFFLQLINGIDYLHKKGIKHRDLKLENLLLDENYNVKLSDFGYATEQVTDNALVGSAGYKLLYIYIYIYRYVAPEIGSSHYDPIKSDIFSLGVCLFILISGKMPFGQTNNSDQAFSNFSDDADDYFQKHEVDIGSNKELLELLKGILEPDPEKRLSIEEIKNSEWMKGSIPTLYQIRREIDSENYEEDFGVLSTAEDLPNYPPGTFKPMNIITKEEPKNRTKQLESKFKEVDRSRNNKIGKIKHKGCISADNPGFPKRKQSRRSRNRERFYKLNGFINKHQITLGNIISYFFF